MPLSSLDLLLVIPAFCESKRLPAFIETLVPCFEKNTSFSTRILVVDDHSPYEEWNFLQHYLEELSITYPVLLPPLRLETNLGKGGAIYHGWQTGPQATWLGFVDADGAVDAKETFRVAQMALAQKKYGAFFGSRIRMLGRHITRSAFRHYLSRLFATLVGNWIDTEVYDSQCGLKFVRCDCFEPVVPWLKEQGFAFDIELLAALRHYGALIMEVPLDWQEKQGSKVTWKESLQLLMALFQIARRKKSWKEPRSKEKGL